MPRHPGMPPPPKGAPPASPRPNPAATMAESKVTIGPRPAAGGAAPGAFPKVPPPKTRRPADQTIVTGAQPSADSDPWGFDPPDVPPKR